MSTTDMTKPIDDQSLPKQAADSRRSRRFRRSAFTAARLRQKPGDSITDPIFCASTYTFADTQSVIDFIEEKQPREEYGRYGNPGERVAERKLAALEGGEMAVLFSSGMAAIVGLLMAKLNAGDEVIFFDECYHRSREFCSKHLSRFGVKTRAGAGVRLRRDGSGHHAQDEAACQRVADQSAPEHRRSGPVRADRRRSRRGDADRRHAGHAVQPAADRRRRRLRAALGHEVPGRAQRPAGRRGDRLGREAGAGSQPARHHGRGEQPAELLPALPRAEDVRAADAAAQRERPARGRVSGSASARREGVLSGPRVARVPRRRPADRCAASAAW